MTECDVCAERRARHSEMLRRRRRAEFQLLVFQASLWSLLLLVVIYLLWRAVTSEERMRAAYLDGWSEVSVAEVAK